MPVLHLDVYFPISILLMLMEEIGDDIYGIELLQWWLVALKFKTLFVPVLPI